MATKFNIAVAVTEKGISATVRDIDRMGQGAKRAGGEWKRLQGHIKGVAFAAAAAVPAMAALFARESLKAAQLQAQAIAQLDASLKSTGFSAGFTSKELRTYAAQLQRVTNFGDEATVQMTSVLLTFTNIRETLPDVIRLTQDVATKMGTNLQAAALQLGKALNDPVANLGELSRAGIQFSKEQKKVIKSLFEGGRQAEAQRVILAELERQFGGSAKAARDASLGAEALDNAFGDLKETIGQQLTPAVREYNRQLTLTIEEFDKFIDRHDHAIQVLKLFASGQQTQAGMLAAVLVLRGKEIEQIEKTSSAYQEFLQKNKAAAAERIALVEAQKKAVEDAAEAAAKAIKKIVEKSKDLLNSFSDQSSNLDDLTKKQLKATREYLETAVAMHEAGLSTDELTVAYHKYINALDVERIQKANKAQKEMAQLLASSFFPKAITQAEEIGRAIGEWSTNTKTFIKVLQTGLSPTLSRMASELKNLPGGQQAKDALQGGSDNALRPVGASLVGIWDVAVDRMTETWANSWEDVVAHAIRGLADVLRGTADAAETFRDLWVEGGRLTGEALGGPIGGALGEVLSGLQFDLWSKLLGFGTPTRGFAGQNIGAVGGALVGGEARKNKSGDVDTLGQLMDEFLRSINSVFDSLGIEIASLNDTFDLILQDGEGLIVSINGVQTAFGEDLQGALGFLLTEITKSGEFVGLAAEGIAAMQQAAAESGGDLEKFASDVKDIQTILEASGPQIPEAVRELRDQFEETKRLADQAARFGLDASGVWDRLNENIDAFRESLSRTALLASIPTGQGVDAIRRYFDEVVRPMVLAFNQFAREAGLDEIKLSDIDAIQRGAVNQERQRQADALQAAFDQANETVQDTTRSFMSLAGTLDPVQEQLRQLKEQYDAAMEAATEQGIATDDLTKAYNDATRAVQDNAAAVARQEKQNLRRSTVSGLRGSAIELFEIAAELGLKTEKQIADIKWKVFQAEWRIRIAQFAADIALLETMGVNTRNMKALLGDIQETFDLIVASGNIFLEDANEAGDNIIYAGERFAQTVRTVGDEWADFESGIFGLLGSVLGGGPGGVFGGIASQFDPILAAIAGLPVTSSALVRGIISQILALYGDNPLTAGLDPNAASPIQNLLEFFEKLKQMKIDEVFQGLLEPIRDFYDALKRGDFGGVNPQAAFAEAKKQFDDVWAAIMSGDPDAISKFAPAAQNLLDIARQMFGSGPAFQAIRDMILKASEGVLDLDPSAFQDPMLKANEAQVDLLQQSLDTSNAQVAQQERTNRLLTELVKGEEANRQLNIARLGRIEAGQQELRLERAS